jgi:dipeptidyl aminopeptidase/acylaminoacyl peptidase
MEEPLNPSNRYLLPPTDIAHWVDVPREPSVIASPNYDWLLVLQRNPHPSIGELAKPMAKLAGFRFEPQSRRAFQTEFWSGMELRRFQEEEIISIPLVCNARIGRVSWSHRSTSVAFTLCFDDRTELWWFDVTAPQEPKRVCADIVEGLCEFDWASDGERLIYFEPHFAEVDRPQADIVPRGPVIEESIAIESPARTYQDLLNNQADADLFEFLVTTQVVVVQPRTLEEQRIGGAGMYLSCDESPDGQHFLVSELKKPFSYTLPFQFFPRKTSVWGSNGLELFPICDLPVADRIPIEGVRTGPRHINWLPGADAKLIWCEALDGGDPRKQVEYRDRIMAWEAPFQSAAKELLCIPQRYTGRLSLSESNLMLVTQYDRDRRWTRTLLHDLDSPQATPRVLSDRNINDHYGDPGSVMTIRDARGSRIALQFGNAIALSGHGASPEGALPFLDMWDLKWGKARRVWRCETGCYESVVHIREDSEKETLRVVTRHESKASPPNCRLHHLGNQTTQWITNFADPLPELRDFPKRLVRYQRRDGIELSATLYLPKNHREGERLPLLLWAYPLEYSDSSTASQITRSPDRFTRLMGCSHLTLLTQGFAIMDNATMPVVGDSETMNDRFIEQVVQSAEAAIDFAVNEGIADRERVGIGGHSYGAFMVANLMAHSQLFRAGIARSGAYNRTLTPFGFQAERRPLWQAKEVYQQLSPFLFADQIKQPLLLIHGEDDNNPGTLTIQSKRMYQAIKGNGGICRLVLLPHEGHGYKARESVLHTQAEMVSWLNRYVRDR